MTNENELIVEYEMQNVESLLTAFFGEAVPDLCAMRDDVNPRAVAMHFLKELEAGQDGVFCNLDTGAVIRAIILEYLQHSAKEMLAAIPTCGPYEYAQGEEARLRSAMLAGENVCYKGGEMYGNAS
jgi:hypothetical protein